MGRCRTQPSKDGRRSLLPVSLKTLNLLRSTGAHLELIEKILASAQADFGVEPDKLFVPTEPRMSRRRRRRPAWEILRQLIFKRDNFTCVYCGRDDPILMTVDHVIPASKGGADDSTSLVTACFACNEDKADKTIEEWRSATAMATRPLPERKPAALKTEPSYPNLRPRPRARGYRKRREWIAISRPCGHRWRASLGKGRAANLQDGAHPPQQRLATLTARPPCMDWPPPAAVRPDYFPNARATR